MKLAGPLTDNAGGAVLLDVSDEAEARTIVANDPAVRSGIFVYEMHPWKLQPWDEFAKKAKGDAKTSSPGAGRGTPALSRP
jgi:YCII-related domain